MPLELRNQMAALLGADVGLGSAMRDAALKAIGRKDLIVDAEAVTPPQRKPPRKAPNNMRAYTTVGVNLTGEQLEAVDTAARARGVAVSALFIDALCVALGLPLREAEAIRYPLRRRRSAPPGTKAPKVRKTPAKAKKRKR